MAHHEGGGGAVARSPLPGQVVHLGHGAWGCTLDVPAGQRASASSIGTIHSGEREGNSPSFAREPNQEVASERTVLILCPLQVIRKMRCRGRPNTRGKRQMAQVTAHHGLLLYPLVSVLLGGHREPPLGQTSNKVRGLRAVARAAAKKPRAPVAEGGSHKQGVA